MYEEIPKSAPEPHTKEVSMAPAKVTVHGSIADKMKVGEPAAMSMKGTVSKLAPSPDHDDHYDVEIQEPHFEHISNDGKDENLADAEPRKEKENLATMPKEKFKKMIMKDKSSGY